MIFNSKQLEELENIHDSTGAFEEEGDDEGGFDEVGEAALDWRRGLIEEAAENIKRAKTRPVEPHLTYPIGSMLFEREARRFARVQRSVPGYLKIVYLSGGDREFGTLDVTTYLRDYGAEKRLSELAEQLGMNDADVAAELERLGITPLDEPEVEEPVADDASEAAAPVAPPLPRGSKAAPPVEDEDVDDDEVVGEGDEAAPAAQLASGKPSKATPTHGKATSPKPTAATAGAAPAVPVGKATAAPMATKKDVRGPTVPARGAPSPTASPADKASSRAVATRPAESKGAPAAKPASSKTPVLKEAGSMSAASKMPAQNEAASKGAVPKGAVPKGAVPKGAVPKGAVPKGAVPKGAPVRGPAPPPVRGATPTKVPPAKSADGKINPIDDPNGYIKAHYQELSNRELARLTGLSEHTIRRKLGEWGLKRKPL